MIPELSPDGGEISVDPLALSEDRLEQLILALNELKTGIRNVEERHPSLRDDLSSLCDLAIRHLTRTGPDEPLPIEPEPPNVPIAAQPEDQPTVVAETLSSVFEANHLDAGVDATTAPTQATRTRPGLAASPFDHAADGLAGGFDKMGDGIIFVIEKILSIGSRKKPPQNKPTQTG